MNKFMRSNLIEKTEDGPNELNMFASFNREEY